MYSTEASTLNTAAAPDHVCVRGRCLVSRVRREPANLNQAAESVQLITALTKV